MTEDIREFKNLKFQILSIHLHYIYHKQKFNVNQIFGYIFFNNFDSPFYILNKSQ